MAHSRRKPRRSPSYKAVRTSTPSTPELEALLVKYMDSGFWESADGASRWTCGVPGCDSTLNIQGASDVIRHLGIHLPPEKRRNVCTVCQRRFTQDSGLRRHMDSIHLKKKKTCIVDGCEWTCSDRSTLTHHCQRKHGWLKRVERYEGKQMPMSQILAKKGGRPRPDPLASFATGPSASTSSSIPHPPLLEAGPPSSALCQTGPTPLSTRLPSLHQFLAGSPAAVSSTLYLPGFTNSSSPVATHLPSTQALFPVGLFSLVSPESQVPLYQYFSTSRPSRVVSSSTQLLPVQDWHQLSRVSSLSLSPVSPHASESSAPPLPAVPRTAAPLHCLSGDPPSPLMAREVQCELVCEDPKWRQRMLEANWSKHDGGGD